MRKGPEKDSEKLKSTASISNKMTYLLKHIENKVKSIHYFGSPLKLRNLFLCAILLIDKLVSKSQWYVNILVSVTYLIIFHLHLCFFTISAKFLRIIAYF